MERDIDELRPYPDEEVPAALARLAENPWLDQIRQAYFPEVESTKFQGLLRSIQGSLEFQRKVIAPAIDRMLAATSGGLSVSGLERLSKDRTYTFISNHRDIVCDPALFTYARVKQGWESPWICLGENLLGSPWVKDLVKVNRGVTVKRGLSQRELLRWSQALSHLLNQVVREGKFSVWIAQREGRAKDGNDLTHAGVIKMLTLSRGETLVERARELRIVPVAVSYELDPCDAMKARELHYAVHRGGYRKKPGEDELSMRLGIEGQKGRIHIGVGSEIELAMAETQASRREQADAIAAEVDRQIHGQYRLWPSNYVATDLLDSSTRWSSKYTENDRRSFEDRMETQLELLQEPGDELPAIRRKFLEMYANSVRNSPLAR